MENNNDLDMQEATELFMDRADQGISKGGRFTSGRVDIWKYYIERIGFLGHQNETIYPTSNGGFLNAHNAYIQLSYSAGIVSGIGLIILSVFLVVRAIKMIINEVKEKRWTPELLFAVMISAGFALRVMVSALYTPFNYALTVAFWVVISTFMVKNHYSMRKRYER